MRSALVLEGNRAVSDRVCQLLGLLDVDARPAYTPQAALLTLTETIPDLIFISVQGANDEGMDILDFLRSELQLADVPVIVSMEPQDEICRRVEKAGAFEIIPRPASLEAIEKVLRKAGFT